MARFEKDFRQLIRRLHSVFNGQVQISVRNNFDGSKSTADDETPPFGIFYVEITPNDGLYAHASYVFSIETNDEYCYPDCAPLVSCLTRIYHPNIDTRSGQNHDNICVSILSDWQSGEAEYTLEDLVQALLFLFYNPNLEDPLTSCVSRDENEFAENVRKSIEGGYIEDFEHNDFEVNYGYQRYLAETEQELEERLMQMSIGEPTAMNERVESITEIVPPMINTSTTNNELTISS